MLGYYRRIPPLIKMRGCPASVIMKRKFTFALAVLIALMLLGSSLANAAVTVSGPENLVLSLTGDTTEMAVTWWDDSGVAAGQVRYGLAEGLSDAAVAAARRTVSASGYSSFEAVMTGLVAGETYYYQVGSAAGWSDIRSFVAPQEDTGSLTFLFMGDAQFSSSITDYEAWGALLENAYENYDDAAFAVMGGDMVNNGQNAAEWQAFLSEASPVFSRLPLLAAPGNHESNDIVTGKPTLMNKLLSMPKNGPAGFEEEFYSFDYGECHILCLNSNVFLNEQLNAGAMTLADFDRIKAWIASELGSSSAAWKIVVMHHPAYSVVSDMAGAAVFANWVPLFEAAEVDLALYGHQHVYMRTKPMWQGQVNYAQGITYLMGVSGSKYYPASQAGHMETLIENTSTYQAINIDDDTLTLKTFNAGGEALDGFSLSARARPPAPKYIVTAVEDGTAYVVGETDGISAMTVKEGVTGLKYFGTQIAPVVEHGGQEAVVFVHLREGLQLSINVTRADFDLLDEAQAGFNVQAGDIVRVYIVDDLTNDLDSNPIVLQ